MLLLHGRGSLSSIIFSGGKQMQYRRGGGADSASLTCGDVRLSLTVGGGTSVGVLALCG